MEVIDELRELAKAFPETSTRRTLLMRAADTIWELRCKLAGVVDQSDEIERLKAENAKLREYAESYAKVVECEGCGWCPYDMDALCDIETMPMRDGCKLYDELRKLRIEMEE